MRSYSDLMRSGQGTILLACDFAADPLKNTLSIMKRLDGHIRGIKLNMHALLPLGRDQIRRITDLAHRLDMVAIADVKLNDIGSTNTAAVSILWDMGFDAAIANPIMGEEALDELIRAAHERGRGIITLCHMSSSSAQTSYDLRLREPPGRLYRLFLERARRCNADGLVVGATYPHIIRYCTRSKIPIYSPGVGAQGGSAAKAMSAGSDYLIVGRQIIESPDPVDAIRSLA